MMFVQCLFTISLMFVGSFEFLSTCGALAKFSCKEKHGKTKGLGC